MKKVLFISEGMDISEYHLTKSLPDLDFLPHIFMKPNTGFFNELKNQSFKIHSLPLKSRYDLKTIQTIRSYIKNSPPDIIHCLRNNRPLSNTLIALRGYQHIPLLVYRGTTGHLMRLDPASRMTYLNPRINKIVCVSEAVQRYLLNFGIPKQRLETIYKGHDPSWYGNTKTSFPEEWNIPPNSLKIGFFASMRPVKGGDIILKSAPFLRPHPPLHFLMIGEVRDPKLYRLAKQNKSPHVFHFPGFQVNAVDLIGACDLILMPTRKREGFPRAVIEGMAQGVPPIVSNVGGMPELVENDMSGKVVEPENPRALAEAINELVADHTKRKRMGLNAKLRIEKNFHIKQTIEKTVALYRSLLPN